MKRDLRTPFAGMKHSGLGREGGLNALHFFTEAKMSVIIISATYPKPHKALYKQQAAHYKYWVMSSLSNSNNTSENVSLGLSLSKPMDKSSGAIFASRRGCKHLAAH